MKTLWDYGKEQQKTERADEIATEDKTKEARKRILEHISSYEINTIQDRVAWILNHHPETRDSDITLQLKYWETFESDIYSGGSIRPRDLYKLTRLTSIARARAKIQNEYRLFLASKEVRERRGLISEDAKETAIQNKPNYPVYVVYMDDSGKTSNYLLAGSVWFMANYRGAYHAVEKVRDRHNFEKEFHFKELKPQYLRVYKAAVDALIERGSSVSFKFISVRRMGLAKKSKALTDLYYHLIVRGIEHEHKTGRAPLPRMLQVWVDSEEAELDTLRLANLEDQLKNTSEKRFDGQLVIDNLFSTGSSSSLMLQMADLLVGSVNRLLNRSGTTFNYKDELAEYLLGALGIKFDFESNDVVGDKAVHIQL